MQDNISKTKLNQNIKSYIRAGVIVFLFTIFCGFFHISISPFGVIPKSNFTFKMTIVSVSEVIDNYNAQTFGERVRGDILLNSLVKEMEQRGWIDKKVDRMKSEERVW